MKISVILVGARTRIEATDVSVDDVEELVYIQEKIEKLCLPK